MNSNQVNINTSQKSQNHKITKSQNHKNNKQKLKENNIFKQSNKSTEQKINQEMKGKLFGGMKVKGPSTKPQQTKKQQTPSVSQTSLDTKPQPHIAEHKESTRSQSRQQPGRQPQLKQSKTSIQSVLKQQQPKLQKKQFIKEASSRQFAQNLQKEKEKPKQKSQKPSQRQEQQETIPRKQQVVVVRKDFTKSRSQKNYDDDSEDMSDVREDRSVVVGRPQEEKEEIQFKKCYKGKPISTALKSNPLLNQIKKITTKATNLQASKDKESQSLVKQTLAKGSKLPNTSTKQQKPQKPKRQKSTIMQQLYSSHNSILYQLIKKKQAKQQIISLTKHILQRKQQLSLLTNKQNHYIATQEYELADKLQGKITQVTGQICEEEVEINFVQEELFRIELEGVAMLRAHLEEEKRTIRRLKLVELDIQDEISHFKRQQQQKIETSRSVNQNEKKKYQRIVNDIKNQSQQLGKYQQTFYQDLNSRKLPLESQLNEQQHKRTQLEAEIKQLQEKLKKKKTILKSTLASIQSTRQKITEVDNTFQEEKRKLEERKKHITLLQNEKNHQSKKVKENQDNVRQLEKLKSQNITQMTKEKLSYHQLSTNIQSFFQSIDVDEYLAKKKIVIEEFIKHSRALKSFEEMHKEKREKIKEFEFQKSNTLSEITKNQERIKQLKQRIPKLQSQQKQLSLVKNFKGAAMKKSEIKQCTDSIEDIKKQIEQAYATQAEIDSNIEEINADQEKYVDEQNILRKSLAISQFRLAVEKKKELVKELQWMKELQKGSKAKESYESKLKEELEQIEQEITYIAQQYELQEEKQQKSSKKISLPIKRQQKIIEASEASYMALTINDQQGNENENLQSEHVQKSVSSSNKPLQEQENKQQNDNNINSQALGQQQNGQSHHTQSQQESVDEPLQLEVNAEQQQDVNDGEDNLVEEEQEGEESHEQENREEEEQQDDGYVPLQLD